MDGFGLGPKYPGNAVENTPKPHLENIFKECPGCRLSASGLDVGLPEGQMGNSEVGHTNIGAGRVVFQDLPHISRDIDSGEFFKNPAYLEAMEHCREWGTALHLMGLLSDGGVHSHITHLFALVKMAKEQGLEKVYVHCFLDGRDVPPSSGKSYVEQLQAKLDELGTGRIATVMGRYYAMDRDKRWDRVQRAYYLDRDIDKALRRMALEVSSKSEVRVGKEIGAFSLELDGIFLENVFQAAKQYENGGPYLDLLNVSPKQAKRDERHCNSGKLVGFVRNDEIWTLEPKTAFYDYIYISALIKNFGYDLNISEYQWFTDIEFNPQKSINCQARAVAIYVALQKTALFNSLKSKDSWITFHERHVKG